MEFVIIKIDFQVSCVLFFWKSLSLHPSRVVAIIVKPAAKFFQFTTARRQLEG